jgi:hypothetical protein
VPRIENPDSKHFRIHPRVVNKLGPIADFAVIIHKIKMIADGSKRIVNVRNW